MEQEPETDNALFQENERQTPLGDGRRYFDAGDMQLKAGGFLPSVTVAYETWGELNPSRSNAVLICHALSGDSHAVGWWDRLVGPGRTIDTEKYFVVGTNVLGGCRGTTGPCSMAEDGKPYGSRFPTILVEDMVEAQKRLTEALGVGKWALVAGGSMGGMQAIQWSVQCPQMVDRVWCTASCAAHSAMQIGFNEAGRQAVLRDPAFLGGDYYPGPGPVNGLAVARMIGHLTFLSESSFASKFGRALQGKEAFSYNGGTEFAVESYLNYQGDKFNQRFDANSHLVLTRAIDYYRLESFSGAGARFLFTAFDSDWIYPSHQSRELHRLAQLAGCQSEFVEINCPWGHDAFLLEEVEQGRLVRGFLSV
ncbi:MAG: homoserine O-acetyltransferase [Armatimonadetes bacterium]|nr:homoserine O-acetyltransferase [Armatimonadota bacterium]MBS1711878.1 homoserine O-acetyltransferase [Armatimonadota bacterium]MBX3109568.1 homoserine O-acetyltransferase [Fimbriimonadaceae bacterium]